MREFWTTEDRDIRPVAFYDIYLLHVRAFFISLLFFTLLSPLFHSSPPQIKLKRSRNRSKTIASFCPACIFIFKYDSRTLALVTMMTTSSQRWPGWGPWLCLLQRLLNLALFQRWLGLRNVQSSLKSYLPLIQFSLLLSWSLFPSESYF